MDWKKMDEFYLYHCSSSLSAAPIVTGSVVCDKVMKKHQGLYTMTLCRPWEERPCYCDDEAYLYI